MQTEKTENSSLTADQTHTEPLIFDREALFRQTQNNVNLVQKLIVIYQEEMSKSLNELRTYVQIKDYDKISSCAHNVKGASANMGCMALSCTAAKMQEAAIKCQYDTTFNTLSEMEMQYDILLNYIGEI
ncbi:Hpt domain-containing protein [Methanolobus vulcani]|nr:Hpt domain-containing protein [Methanolobus vulcani]